MYSYWHEMSKLQNVFNYLDQPGPDEILYRFYKYLSKNTVKDALHVGNVTFNEQSHDVYQHLAEDRAKSITPWIEELLEAGYKTLFYNGHLDVREPYPRTVDFVKDLNWKHKAEFGSAKKQI